VTLTYGKGMGERNEMKLELHAFAILIVSCHTQCSKLYVNFTRLMSSCKVLLRQVAAKKNTPA